MKLRKSVTHYLIPQHSSILAVTIPGNQPHNQVASFMLQAVGTANELIGGRESGRPERYLLISGDRIEFDPPPDKPYIVTVRYAPPIQEF